MGSTPIGAMSDETANSNGKRRQALAAEGHMIVLPDADVETAADAGGRPRDGSVETVHGDLVKWWPSATSPTVVEAIRSGPK